MMNINILYISKSYFIRLITPFSSLVKRPLNFNINKCKCTFHTLYHEQFPPDKFLPLNLNPSESQKIKDLKDFHALHQSVSQTSKESILVNSLGLSNAAAKKLAKTFEPISEDRLSTNIDIMKSYIDAEAITNNMKILHWELKKCNETLAHNLMILKELGTPLNPFTFTMRYRSLSVRRLRAKSLIPSKYNFPTQIFESLNAPQDIMDSLPKSYEEKPFKQVYFELMKIFFKWKMDTMGEEFFTCNCNMNYPKSLTLLNQNWEILTKELKFDTKRVIAYPLLMFGYPKNYRDIIDYKGKLCNLDPFKFVNYYPMNLRLSLRRIRAIDTILKYINATATAKVYFPLMCVGIESKVVNDIEFYMKKTSITDLRLTPNNVQLLKNFAISSKNLKAYEVETGTSLASLPEFLHLKSRTVCQADKNLVMCFFFHITLNIDKQKVLRGFQETRLLSKPTLKTLKQNYVFLFDKGFSTDLIRECYHVIFYPYEVVKKCEADLINTTIYGLQYSQNKELGKLLHLLLYKIHKLCLKLCKSS